MTKDDLIWMGRRGRQEVPDTDIVTSGNEHDEDTEGAAMIQNERGTYDAPIALVTREKNGAVVLPEASITPVFIDENKR